MLPLDGIMVVALEQAVAAPFATRQLADLGARVIKIERPVKGDFARYYDTRANGQSSHFVWLNRSKESLTLDVKHPEVLAVLRQLLAKADVFVHNLAPGAVDRLGLGSATLTESSPRLITCQISGYGSGGPFEHKRAYDLLIQGEVGLLSITGTSESPSKVGIAVADIAAGMYAFSGILTALYTRERTGRGAVLEVSLFDALAEWMGHPMYYAASGSGAPARTGAHHATIAPYGPFRTGDGQSVTLGVQNDREWRRFCADVLGDATIADDMRFRTNPDRLANRPALEALITERFSRLSADALLELLDRAQIACARMNTVEQALQHPQLLARRRWRDIATPNGPLATLLPPVSMSGVEPVMNAIPEIGAETDAILEEVGVARATIDAWRHAGVI
jgi:itaconate CoA-transferase